MTHEQIEQKALQAFPNGIYNDTYFNAMQEQRREGYITGALSRQPEIDQLKERVKELEEGLGLFIKSYERDYPIMCKNAMNTEYNTGKQLLTKNNQP